MSYKRYLILFLISIGSLLTLNAVFNRIMDPFWYYQDVEIDHLNTFKNKVREFERHVKPQLLLRKEPKALILGSSFSEIGLNPQNPEFTDQGRLSGYNFAFAGAGWEKVQCYFLFAVNNIKVSRVVLGLHPAPLPLVDCSHILPEVDSFSEAKLLLSLQALKSSFSTLQNQKKRRFSHTKDGMYYFTRGAAHADVRFHEFFINEMCKLQCDCAQALQNINKFKAETDIPSFNKNIDLSGLRNIVRIAKSKNIELNLYVYPKHALFLEVDMLCGAYRYDWSSLEAIARLLKEEKASNAKLWLFYDYNDFTGESVIPKEPIYWQDPGHFNYEFGDKILNKMFTNNSETIGYQVTVDNVAEIYKNFISNRQSFLKSNVDFVSELKALLPDLLLCNRKQKINKEEFKKRYQLLKERQ